MKRNDGPNGIVEFRNDDGCPYTNQTLNEALQNSSRVLSSIDLRSLPGDLQAELYQLRRKYSDLLLGATAR